MGCGSSKISHQDLPHDEVQQEPIQISPSMAAKPSFIAGEATTIQPINETRQLVDETQGITDPTVNKPETLETATKDLNDLGNMMVVKISDLDHPLAIVIKHLSAKIPLVIQNNSSVSQQYIAEVNEIGHDMALIKYLCARWHVSLLHQGVINAVVDEWICDTIFHFLPGLKAINLKWTPATPGSLQYSRW
ncbi:hypothetical protein BVRB_026640 [Beta vulgaris subsp. vulgaris]|uniref:Uncharacterized protein n=1 Tax=Beta vulgaris subsp. vulgaris TaxID=3555 RepID=A0A0J8DT19_BETVV|nr:hypothetical protein BVRB_026640 [Beta vulgaris subsp. vulgaris]